MNTIKITSLNMREIKIENKSNDDQEAMQDNAIDRLASDVEDLLNRANKKDYVPTLHEKQKFDYIVGILTNMSKWF